MNHGVKAHFELTKTASAIHQSLSGALFGEEKKRLLAGAFVLSSLAGSLSIAGPENGQVNSGAATITMPDDANTVITQTSDRAIISWDEFSIGSEETVTFIHTDTTGTTLNNTGATLNRVTGNEQSLIDGLLQSNGRVYLINNNGIVIGSETRFE